VPPVIAYLIARARAWVARHVVAPTGSDYDRIDQDLTRRVRVPPRWQ
jgi:hypothetical protein